MADEPDPEVTEVTEVVSDAVPEWDTSRDGGAATSGVRHARIAPNERREEPDDESSKPPSTSSRAERARAAELLKSPTNRSRLQSTEEDDGEASPVTPRSQHRRTMTRMLTKRSLHSNMQAFHSRHGSFKAGTIRMDVDNTRKQIKFLSKGQRFVMHPDRNRWLVRWDAITSIALIWTAVVTPFETSFLPPSSENFFDFWFVANRTLDLVFSLDLVLQFFVAYQTNDSFGGRTWVDDHKQIVKHYVFSWFPLDLSTIVVPLTFDMILMREMQQAAAAAAATAADLAAAAAAKGYEGGDDKTLPVEVAEGGSRLGFLRVLRALRLIKLVRLLRASRIFERWQSSITISYATQTLLKCVFMLFFSAHWYACIIALQATMAGNIDTTWMGSGGWEVCARGDGQNPNGPLISGFDQCSYLSVGWWYLDALTWSTMVITGTGGTDPYPTINNEETMIVLTLIIIGAFLWTYVLASFCDVATNANPALIQFRQNLDGLNHYIHINVLPTKLAKRMRTYLHQQKGVMLREEAKRSLPLLSTALQIEVVLHVNNFWLEHVWFIRDLDAPVKVRLAMAMVPRVLAPAEVAPNRHLYVMMRGQAMYGSKILSRGMAWGDDVVLTEKKYFLPYLARAMTYADVTSVTRDKLYELVESYPSSHKALRRHTMILALRRCVIMMAREAKAQGQKSALDITFNNDFLERMHEASDASVSEGQKNSMNIALELNRTGMGEGASEGAGASAEDVQSMRKDMNELKATLQLLARELSTIKSGQDTLAAAVAKIGS